MDGRKEMLLKFEGAGAMGHQGRMVEGGEERGLEVRGISFYFII